jgi:hypothetical protein
MRTAYGVRFARAEEGSRQADHVPRPEQQHLPPQQVAQVLALGMGLNPRALGRDFLRSTRLVADGGVSHFTGSGNAKCAYALTRSLSVAPSPGRSVPVPGVPPVRRAERGLTGTTVEVLWYLRLDSFARPDRIGSDRRRRPIPWRSRLLDGRG